MNDEQRLAEIRLLIDEIDLQLQDLITKRAQLAVEVGDIKNKSPENKFFYRPEREAQILQHIIDRHKGPLSIAQITLIFRNILTACLNLQHPISVATLGPEGTFSQLATIKHFGIATEIHLTTHINDVFQAVTAQKSDYGVVPIENSTTGVINPVLDTLRTSQLTLCGEILLPVHHCLLSANTLLQDIKIIYAHEQALLQCARWLSQHVKNAQCIPVSSNAEAAKRAQNEKNSAAIASEFAAQQYHLQILEKNIEDQANNITRFLILGQQKSSPSGHDKTSLLISTPHTPGSLFDLLKPFAENNINISLIESRPSQDSNWAYYFFIDIDGHQEDPPVKHALEMLERKSIMLHILGSYPKAVI